MPKVKASDGVELHYYVDDFRDPWAPETDEAIFMHHGYARSGKWWIQWVPGLSRKYKVIRNDCRGCGQSDVPPSDPPWTAERLSQDCLDIADDLGIKKLHWVGFESGGTMGMFTAITHPDWIKSLTLVNTPYKILDKPRSLYNQGTASMADAIDKLGLRQWLVNTMSNRLDMDLADPRMVEWHIEEHSKTSHAGAIALQLVFQAVDLSGALPKIMAPTLLMTGDKSANSPIDDQLFVKSQLGNCKGLVVFPNIAAGIQLHIPDQCVEATLRFIDSV
ncbi:MAG: alpha/beta hydrolase [Dehalococcoidia bacterium]|jgi:3-oxoadipate enol-lactonase|nr:alpha/beta hydrolase [Dehalococcoidia bacterium]MDP7511348.1 alpha/beta hydrolase [Dehalococcoidia bacterium]HJN87301.1 alpha/beta hydrolase [Dehalococcoidia bacterium]